jgi:hypothetical protein
VEALLTRRYDEAESEFRKQTAGRLITGDYIVASLYLQTGRTPEALAELRAGAAGPKPGALELMYLGHALASFCRETLIFSRNFDRAVEISMVYAAALSWFRQTFANYLRSWIPEIE